MRLKGKCTVVTGGARGIGKAIAKRFIAEGAKVVIADIDSVQGSNAAEEIGASFHKTDVSSKIEVEALVEQVVQMFGSIDVVVNNGNKNFVVFSLHFFNSKFITIYENKNIVNIVNVKNQFVNFINNILLCTCET